MMAKKKTRYVILSRDSGGWYEVWPDGTMLFVVRDGAWENQDELQYIDDFCHHTWHTYTGLVLHKGTKRRIKITFYKGGGCSWRWAGKAKHDG